MTTATRPSKIEYRVFHDGQIIERAAHRDAAEAIIRAHAERTGQARDAYIIVPTLREHVGEGERT